MTAKQAIEIVTSSGNPGEIVEAVRFLMDAERERDELRDRCYQLTQGHICIYCKFKNCAHKAEVKNT